MTDAAGDAFTRELFAWQAQILADRTLTPICLHVALVIGQHVNRQTGEAWPSQDTIAAALSMTPEGVRKAVQQLVGREHLKVAIRHGRGDSNRYRLARKTPTTVPVSASENPNDGSGLAVENPNRGSGIIDENPNGGLGFGAENPNHGWVETPTVVGPNHLIEPSEEESLSRTSNSNPKPKRTRPAKPVASDSDFDQAYGLYPRHVGRDAARRAYAAAIGRGVPPPEILAGIRRYAAERSGEPERFTAHMASWLNAGRWADSPTRSSQPPGGGGRPPRFDPIADAARRLAEMPDD